MRFGTRCIGRRERRCGPRSTMGRRGLRLRHLTGNLGLDRLGGYLGHGPHREILSWSNLASENPQGEPIRVIFLISRTLGELWSRLSFSFAWTDIWVLTSMHPSDCPLPGFWGRPSSVGAMLLSERYDALGAEAGRRWHLPGSDPRWHRASSSREADSR